MPAKPLTLEHAARRPTHGPQAQAPGMAMNTAQHEIVNVLKHYEIPFVFGSVCVFNTWPKTLLLPVRPRDTKSWTPLVFHMPYYLI